MKKAGLHSGAGEPDSEVKFSLRKANFNKISTDQLIFTWSTCPPNGLIEVKLMKTVWWFWLVTAQAAGLLLTGTDLCIVKRLYTFGHSTRQQPQNTQRITLFLYFRGCVKPVGLCDGLDHNDNTVLRPCPWKSLCQIRTTRSNSCESHKSDRLIQVVFCTHPCGSCGESGFQAAVLVLLHDGSPVCAFRAHRVGLQW